MEKVVDERSATTALSNIRSEREVMDDLSSANQSYFPRRDKSKKCC